MITIIDDLMRSCGGDSAGTPVPSGDGDGDSGRQMVAMGDHQQPTVSRIWTAMSMLNRRTGHARFRRGPVAEQRASSDDQLHPPAESAAGGAALDVVKACEAEARFSASASGTTSSSLPSTTTLTSLTLTAGEGSVSNGRAQGRYLFQPVTVSGDGGRSAGKPLPLAVSSSMQQQLASTDYSPGTARKNGKCRDRARSENDAGCHCSKKRKLRVKQMVRVPAISSRNADIPPDDYSWRKYGQKPIKGSPYPRGYYKCSTVRGCPARKRVERDPAETAMLIVTYQGDHRHDDLQVRAPDGAQTEHATTSS